MRKIIVPIITSGKYLGGRLGVNSFIHINAGTLADAVATLGQGKAAIIAGGTDLLPYMKGMCSPNPPTTLVNIKTVTPSLNYVKVDGGTLKIGALTSLSDIASSSMVVGGWNVLALAARPPPVPRCAIWAPSAATSARDLVVSISATR